MAAPTDQQVKDYIDSVHGLRDEWGIPSAQRTATILFVLMSLALLAIAIGAVAYLFSAGSSLSGASLSGIVIVIVLAYVACGLRIYQLRAERAELPAYRKALAAKLTGDPATDVEAQTQVDASFKWSSLRFRTIERMIGLAALVIIMLNTAQAETFDVGRMLLFDGCILAYLFGAFWNNFALKADILEVQLEERSRATIQWQTEHPGQAQREEAEDTEANHEASAEK